MFFFIHQHIVDWVIWWFFNPMSRKGFSDISTHKLLHQTHKYLEVRRVSVCIFKEHKGSSDGWFRNYLYFLDDSCKQIRRVKSQASTIPLCNRFIRWYHSVVFDTMLFFFFHKKFNSDSPHAWCHCLKWMMMSCVWASAAPLTLFLKKSLSWIKQCAL